MIVRCKEQGVITVHGSYFYPDTVGFSLCLFVAAPF